MSDFYRIGVVGYCAPTEFDMEKTWELVSSGLEIASSKTKKPIMVVGGLTNIPSAHQAGYYIAKQRGWNVGGVACEKAYDYKWFPMSDDGDMLIITGKNWGDESGEFIRRLDAIVRVGGNKQSKNEVELAKKKGIPVYEYDL